MTAYRALIDAYLDGEDTPEQEAQLAAWIMADPENARIFVRETHAHRCLRDTLVAVQVQESVARQEEIEEGIPVQAPFWKRTNRGFEPHRPKAAWAALGLLAACSLILLGVIFYVRTTPSIPPSAPVVDLPAIQLDRPPAPQPETPRPPPIEAPRPPQPPPAQETREAPQPPRPVPSPAPLAPEVPPPQQPSSGHERAEPAVAARVERLQGDVYMTTESERSRIGKGDSVFSGHGIVAQGAGAFALVTYPDGTRVELGPRTTVRELLEGNGKRIFLMEGMLSVEVCRQPAGRPMIVSTSLADIEALGTRFVVSAGETTRVEVRHGRVRFSRRADGASLELTTDQFGVVGKTGSVVARALPEVTRSFQDGVLPVPSYSGTSDATLSEASPIENHGMSDSVEADGDKGTNRNMLFKWDLTEIPPGSRVTNAVLHLHVYNGAKNIYDIHALKRPWVEGEVAWRSAGAGMPWQRPGARGFLDRDPRPMGRMIPVGRGEIAVLLNAYGQAAVQSWINNPQANFGILVPGVGRKDGVAIVAHEASDPAQRPRLTVTYAPPSR